jgi:hypothetical protein
VFLAGKSPNIRSNTVYINGSGQPYACGILHNKATRPQEELKVSVMPRHSIPVCTMQVAFYTLPATCAHRDCWKCQWCRTQSSQAKFHSHVYHASGIYTLPATCAHRDCRPESVSDAALKVFRLRGQHCDGCGAFFAVERHIYICMQQTLLQEQPLITTYDVNKKVSFSAVERHIHICMRQTL